MTSPPFKCIAENGIVELPRRYRRVALELQQLLIDSDIEPTFKLIEGFIHDPHKKVISVLSGPVGDWIISATVVSNYVLSPLDMVRREALSIEVKSSMREGASWPVQSTYSKADDAHRYILTHLKKV